MVKRVSATAFKATCLGLMDRVAQTGEPIEITKRGKSVVRLVAVRQGASERSSIFGAAKSSMLYLAPDADLLSTGADWNVDTP
jgi:prevent-host-death family protein